MRPVLLPLSHLPLAASHTHYVTLTHHHSVSLAPFSLPPPPSLPPSLPLPLPQDRYSSDMPGEAEQDKDPLFVAYKKLAKDQSWLAGANAGIGHKTWTFGYGHKRAIAEEAGCMGVGTWEWNHACVIVWKTSADGTHMQTAHTTHFGHDHSKGIAPTAADISKFIKKEAAKPVKSPASVDL